MAVPRQYGGAQSDMAQYFNYQIAETPSRATPQLIRSSQFSSPSSSAPAPGSSAFSGTPYSKESSSSSSESPPERLRRLGQRAKLEIHGNLPAIALGWSHDEWRNGRRLVQFWRKQEGATIQVICKPILPEQYIPNSIVISCIFWEVTNECYVTSVDIIYLLEALVAARFNVEEKNRIRRNLEGLKPKTISKIGKSNDARISRVHEEFFKQVMSFPSPRPRHIEKDIKIFPWRTLGAALNKIIGKYSTAPVHQPSHTSSGSEGSIQMQSPQVQQPSAPLQQQQHTLQHHHSMQHLQQQAPSQLPLSHRRYASDLDLAQQTMPRQQQPVQQPFTSHHRYSSDNDSSPESRRNALQRPFQPPLSIDVAASNSPYQTSNGPYSSPAYQTMNGGILSSTQHQQHSFAPLADNLQPPYSQPQPSPRRTPGSGSQALFSFSDFVVSPNSFGQTPLQQAQQQHQNSLQPWQYGSTTGPQAQSNNAGYGGLGMDLGLPRRE